MTPEQLEAYVNSGTIPKPEQVFTYAEAYRFLGITESALEIRMRKRGIRGRAGTLPEHRAYRGRFWFVLTRSQLEELRHD